MAASLQEVRGILALWSCNIERDESPGGTHAPARAAIRQEEGVLTFRWINADQGGDAESGNPSREVVRRALASGTAADQ